MSWGFIIQFLISAILGFVFWKLFSGKHEGDKPARSFRPKIGKYRLHLHHWILGSILLMIFLIMKMLNPIILGLLVGSIIQGLLYKDRFIIMYQDKDFDRIYSKFKHS